MAVRLLLLSVAPLDVQTIEDGIMLPKGTLFAGAVYGGIHYRSDIEVGKEHGTRIGGYTVRFGQLDGAGR